MQTTEPKQTTREKARAVAGQLAKMTDEERAQLAARAPGLVTCEGHPITVNNTMLLVLQSGREDLTMIGGFRQWKKAGRSVMRGQHSIGSIMVPMNGRKRQDADESADEESGKPERMHFRFVPMFDISQTEELAQ